MTLPGVVVVTFAVALVESSPIPFSSTEGEIICDENGVSQVRQSAITEGYFCCSNDDVPAWLRDGTSGSQFMNSSTVQRSPHSRNNDIDPLWTTCEKDRQGNQKGTLRFSQSNTKDGMMEQKCAKVNIQQKPGWNMTCHDTSTGAYTGTIHIVPDHIMSDEIVPHMETAVTEDSSRNTHGTSNAEPDKAADDQNIAPATEEISEQTEVNITSFSRPEEPKAKNFTEWTTASECVNGQRERLEIFLDATQCDHGPIIRKTFETCGNNTGNQVAKDAAVGSVSLKMALVICLCCFTMLACFYMGTKWAHVRSWYERRRAHPGHVNNNMENGALTGEEAEEESMEGPGT